MRHANEMKRFNDLFYLFGEIHSNIGELRAINDICSSKKNRSGNEYIASKIGLIATALDANMSMLRDMIFPRDEECNSMNTQ